MSQVYFMQGYGVTHVENYLNEEGIELLEDDCNDFVDSLDDPKDILIACYGEEIGYAIGVSLCYPFETPPFESRKECDDYIYNALYKFLPDKYKQDKIKLTCEIDEYCDYDFC